MGRSGLTGSAVSALLITVVACSSQPPEQGARVHPEGAAGSAAATAAAADGGHAGGAGDVPNENPDNPVAPPSSPTAMIAGAGGAAAGGGGASGDGCQTGTFCPPQEPDPTDCGKLELKTDVMTVEKPGNVMVVFDRSGSMESDWNGVPKYEAAGNALLAALTPLKDLLTVGGIFFPSPAAPDASCPNGCTLTNIACCLNSGSMDTCQVNTIDKADQITWGTADTFINALPMKWHLGNAGGTPLMTGVQRAADAIAAQTFDDPLIVIVMTDGEPNCNTDNQTVLDQIKKWKDAGIATYVVGLPGASAAANLLNSIAAAGGTDQYIDPKDPTELESKLRTVIQSTVKEGFDSCTFHLDPKAEVPDKLHLVITQLGVDLEIPHDWSKDATWSVNPDGTQVDLQGQLCDMAKDGSIEALRFVFGCVTVPPAPPPPEPMLN